MFSECNHETPLVNPSAKKKILFDHFFRPRPPTRSYVYYFDDLFLRILSSRRTLHVANCDVLSPDASRFLAQSQTRMSAIREGRLNAPPGPAPLFHSAADYLPDDPEHQQEVQDFYALKSSRRHFGAYASSNATVTEEDEEDEGDDSEESVQELRRSKGKGRLRPLGAGIRSSWRASRSAGSSPLVRSTSQTSSVGSDGTEKADKGKDRMVDIGLEDSVRLGMMPEDIDHSDMVESATQRPFQGFQRRALLEEDEDDEGDRPPDDIAIQMPVDEEEPAFQQFRRPPPPKSNFPFTAPEKQETTFLPRLSPPTQRGGPHMSMVRSHSIFLVLCS